jgi:hypothetical protein
MKCSNNKKNRGVMCKPDNVIKSFEQQGCFVQPISKRFRNYESLSHAVSDFFQVKM